MSPPRATKIIKVWSILHEGKNCSAWRKNSRLRGISLMCLNTWWEGPNKTILSDTQDQRQWAQTGTQEILSEHQETLTVMVTGTNMLWSSPPWRYSKTIWIQPQQPGVEDPVLNSEKEGWTGRFPVVPSNVRHFGCLNFPFSLPEQSEESLLKFLTLD